MKNNRRFRSIRYWHILSRVLLFVVLPLMLTASYGYAKKNKKTPQRAKYSHRAKQSQADLASLGVAQPGQGKSVTDRVIKTAFTQLGRPYRYGGNSPETGFDCQGFVQWTYGQNGISVPRSSGEQLGHGERIGREDLRPGDILIFRRYVGSARGTHAGIYLGNGKYIHSPRTGDSIRVDNAFDEHHGPRFISARRVIHDPNAPARETLLAAAPEPPLAKSSPVSPESQESENEGEAPTLSKKDRAKAALLAQAEKTGQTGQPSIKPQTHVIKPGDSFVTLVTTYRVPLEKLLAANQLKGRERLQKGQKLIIPAATAKAVAQAKTDQAKAAKMAAFLGHPMQTTAGATHVVESGDIVSSIAKKYGVKTQDVLDANNLTDKTMLRIGQKLNIPGAAAPATPTVAVAQAPARVAEEPTAPAAQPVQVAQAAPAPAEKPESKSPSWRLAGIAPEPATSQQMPQQQPKPEPVASPAAPTPSFTASAPAPIAATATVTAAATTAPAPERAKTEPEPKPQVAALATQPAPETASAAPGASADANVHIIKSGDSISGIAKKYGVKAQDIFTANKLTPKSVLQLGQKIQLPAPAPSAAPALAEKAPASEPSAKPVAEPVAKPAAEPVVTAATPAPAASTSSSEAPATAPKVHTAKAEPAKTPAQPEPVAPPAPSAPSAPTAPDSQTAQIAQSAQPASQGEPDIQATHTVQSGENYSTIAHKYGLKSQALLDANKFPSNRTLHIGEKLLVPKVTAMNEYKPGKKGEKSDKSDAPAGKSEKSRKSSRSLDEE